MHLYKKNSLYLFIKKTFYSSTFSKHRVILAYAVGFISSLISLLSHFFGCKLTWHFLQKFAVHRTISAVPVWIVIVHNQMIDTRFPD